MNEPKDNYSGVSSTLEQQSKLPLYGTTTEQMQELSDAQKEAITALEQRYANPNWFKVFGIRIVNSIQYS